MALDDLLTVTDNVDSGTLTVNPDGSFIYTPSAGFVGQDSFQFTVGDGVTLSATATVTL